MFIRILLAKLMVCSDCIENISLDVCASGHRLFFAKNICARKHMSENSRNAPLLGIPNQKKPNYLDNSLCLLDPLLGNLSSKAKLPSNVCLQLNLVQMILFLVSHRGYLWYVSLLLATVVQ